jgi:hypothetical protein
MQRRPYSPDALLRCMDRSSVATAAPIRKEQPVVVDVVTSVTGAGVQSVGVR